MSKKVELPGKKHYGEVTAFMRTRQVYTKADVVNFLEKECGKNHAAALATAVVMLSPRLTSNRGDPRGNVSNPWGHLAYNEKLPRKVGANGKKEVQRFRFRNRSTPLEARERGEDTKVEQAKTPAKSTKVCSKTTAKVHA